MKISAHSSDLHRVRLAHREVLTRGLKPNLWRDLNYLAMTISWPMFFASAAGLFLSFNTAFALLYYIGDDPIANAPKGNLIYLFYFSIETLATVGYGDMHPQTHWGHIVATLEIFTGMSFLALYTGLIFARFSRPLARFQFATSAVVTAEEGHQMLMLRVANERQNTISGATARLWLVRTEPVAGGRERRRFVELKLVRTENPVFAFSWTLFHEITPDSPLNGETGDTLAAAEASLVLTLTGLDERSGHFLHARQTYPAGAVNWGYRYADMLQRSADGQAIIDYSRLNDIVAVPQAEPAAQPRPAAQAGRARIVVPAEPGAPVRSADK